MAAMTQRPALSAKKARSFPASLASWALATAALAGCGFNSTSSGDLNAATFKGQNCGGFLSDIAGCDLKSRIALGGKVDALATDNKTGAQLALRSDLPGVLEVQGQIGSYTLVGKAVGRAVLTASSGGGDVDRLTIQVDPIETLSYSALSDSTGTFGLRTTGDIDGTYTLLKSVQNFSLFFIQLDNSKQRMLGRETFTYTLDPALAFQSGKDKPTALQFDLQRPKTPGMYPLTLSVNNGMARFKVLIVSEP